VRLGPESVKDPRWAPTLGNNAIGRISNVRRDYEKGQFDAERVGSVIQISRLPALRDQGPSDLTIMYVLYEGCMSVSARTTEVNETAYCQGLHADTKRNQLMHHKRNILESLPSRVEVANVNEMLDHALSVQAYKYVAEHEFKNDLMDRLLDTSIAYKKHMQVDIELPKECLAALFTSECLEEDLVDVLDLLGRMSRLIRVDEVHEFESPEYLHLIAVTPRGTKEEVNDIVTAYLITAWDAWGPELLTYRYTTIYTQVGDQGARICRIGL
jgi:hypothetical protein